MSDDEDGSLESIYSNIIHLIYKTCIWENHQDSCECGGNIGVFSLIPDNPYYRFDLNNGVLFCEKHADYYLNGKEESYQLLHKTYPAIGEFHLINQSENHTTPLDSEVIKKYLLDNMNEAIKKKQAPFPTLVGKFDIY